MHDQKREEEEEEEKKIRDHPFQWHEANRLSQPVSGVLTYLSRSRLAQPRKPQEGRKKIFSINTQSDKTEANVIAGTNGYTLAINRAGL